MNIRPILVATVISLLASCKPIPSGLMGASSAISELDKLTESAMDGFEYEKRVRILSNASLLELVNSDRNQQEFVLDQHSNYAIAKRAAELGLESDLAIAAKLAEAREKILIAALAEQVTEAVVLPAEHELEALAKQKYEANITSYFVPESRNIEHILIADTPLDCKRKELPSSDRLAEVLRQIDAGRNFNEIAGEYSDDAQSAPKGGAIEIPVELESDRFIASVARATFELTHIGQISPPVRSKIGTHIIKLTAINAAYTKPFDAVKGELIASEKQRIRYSAVESLRSRAYPAIESIDLTQVNQILKNEIDRRAGAQRGLER